MTLFTKAATTALLATVAFGSVAPAIAHHIKQQAFVESESVELLNAVRSVGVHVLIDEPSQCKEGLYGMAAMTSDRKHQYLIICEENHKDDKDELADTIRHEAIHVAQHCRARRLGTLPQPLIPQNGERYVATASNELHMPMDRYPEGQWEIEAEARVGAQVLDEHEVATIVRTECRRR